MKKYLLLLALPLALCFAACSDDDDKDSPKGSNKTVVIDENGKASNGAVFAAIDDQNFYLDYIQYTILNGHLVVSGYDKENFKGVAKIAAEIQYNGTTYKVEEIGNGDLEYWAFYDCKTLTSITIPNTVKSIGEDAFNCCEGLTSITFPESLTSIGEDAFFCCEGLTDVTFPKSLTSIGGYAFESTGLKSVTIPKTVTSIGDGAFCDCQALTSIKVDKGNPNYDSSNNCNAIIETATNTLIAACKNTVIPNSVTVIGNSAFYGCTELTTITIPENVTRIEDWAFGECTGLTSITLPEKLTIIEDYIFAGCKGLKSITIPNSVTSIGANAFEDCSGLTDVTIPANVTSIGAYAFDACKGLTDVTIPANVTSIGMFAFQYCSNLNKMHFKGKTPPTCPGREDLSFIFRETGSNYPTIYVPSGSINAYKHAFGNGFTIKGE